MIQVQSHTFVEINREINSTVILSSAESFKKGCGQLQVKVCAQITGLLLVQACPEKSVLGELTVLPSPQLLPNKTNKTKKIRFEFLKCKVFDIFSFHPCLGYTHC